MKSKNYIYWKGWLLVVIGLVSALLIFNFLLPLPALFPVIGDENVWFNNLSSGVFTIAAAVIGWILQKQYKDREVEKERQRQCIREEIDQQNQRFDKLNNIIRENISVLNFESRFRNLLSQIDPTTTNMQLINNISEYKQQLIDTQNKLTIFFVTKDDNPEISVYILLVNTIVEVYSKILDGFINYLNKTDSGQIKIKKIDILIPIVNEANRIKLSTTKIEGVELFQEWKNYYLEILKQKKSNMDKMNMSLDEKSQALLKYINGKIMEQRKKLESI